MIEKKRNSNLVRCSFRFLLFFCSSVSIVKTRERREENAVAKRRKEEGKKKKSHV